MNATDGNDQADPRARPANKRGAARLAAVQALYQMELAGTPIVEVIAEFENFRLGREIDGEQYRDADAGWFRDIVEGVLADQRIVDPKIHEALVDAWPLKRVDATLRAILRAGAFELLRRKDVPARAVISEYVDIAKAFFDDDERKIVNGVLDRVAREFRADELGERG